MDIDPPYIWKKKSVYVRGLSQAIQIPRDLLLTQLRLGGASLGWPRQRKIPLLVGPGQWVLAMQRRFKTMYMHIGCEFVNK